jgi:hypothetical protein
VQYLATIIARNTSKDQDVCRAKVIEIWYPRSMKARKAAIARVKSERLFPYLLS